MLGFVLNFRVISLFCYILCESIGYAWFLFFFRNFSGLRYCLGNQFPPPPFALSFNLLCKLLIYNYLIHLKVRLSTSIFCISYIYQLVRYVINITCIIKFFVCLLGWSMHKKRLNRYKPL